MNTHSYGMRTTLDFSFDDAIRATIEALKAEGFGVLTEIDVQATLKKKLDVGFRRYMILGACNPPLAYQALQSELEIGLLMPCNVIVYEADDGQTVVSIADPIAMLGIASAETLQSMAQQARQKLQVVLQTLAAG